MRLRPLLLAIPLALALPLAASAVTLQPVPWTSAGHGDPTSLGLIAGGSLDCVTASFFGCATDTGEEFVYDIPASEGPTLSLSTGTFDFSADVVSQVSGNTWTVGLINISLTTPPPPANPATPMAGEVEFFQLGLSALVFAVLDVPVASGDPTTEIALSRTSTTFLPSFESAALGAGGSLAYGGVNTFLAGDRLVFVGILSFHASGFVDHRGATPVFETSTTTDCGTSDFLDTSDCTQSMSAFQPVSVPEPRLGLLLGSAAGLAALRRRRR